MQAWRMRQPSPRVPPPGSRRCCLYLHQRVEDEDLLYDITENGFFTGLPATAREVKRKMRCDCARGQGAKVVNCIKYVGGGSDLWLM